MKATALLKWVLVLACFLLVAPGPSRAQEPQPPGGEPGSKFPGEAEPLSPAPGVAAQATGGPDGYGYTWNDMVAFQWIDATDGSDSGLAGDDRYSDPIDIGFSFRFYENVYTQVHAGTNGYLSFGQGYTSYRNRPIPGATPPHSFIAPFWDDLIVGTSGNAGKVYYERGGTAPNRYLVVEWWQVSRYGRADLLTFEAVLYEDGQIVLQYQSLAGSLDSATVGIENDVGSDGLLYLYNAAGLANNKAVRFSRPAPAARVRVYPLYQGALAGAGQVLAFRLPIRNTGELGADTFALTADSAWRVSFYGADGQTPLADTNGDGKVDTGPLAQGASATVIVKVQAPALANVGDRSSAVVVVRSAVDPACSKAVTLQMAIPAPFAQICRDAADGAVSLRRVLPSGQAVDLVAPNRPGASDLAVSETPDGLACLWTEGAVSGSHGIGEIWYALLRRNGQTIRAAARLADHRGATMATYDARPAVAAAPNGRVGVAWCRQVRNEQGKDNYNVYWAILDAVGNVTRGPENITGNDLWGAPVDLNVPTFSGASIAATDDGRFVLAWVRSHRESPGLVDDVYYCVRDGAGAEVKAITRWTAATAGGDAFDQPNLARLAGNRALLVWHAAKGGRIYDAVLDSGGNPVRPPMALSYGWGADAAQLADGHIALAWTALASLPGNPQLIFYALLDGAYNVSTGPVGLVCSAALAGSDAVSVAADATGHAVLTWMDGPASYHPNLYYALIGGNGSLLTPPQIQYTSGAATPLVVTSSAGYGNTSLTLAPSTAHVDTWVGAPAVLPGPAGATVAIPIGVGNDGAATATGATLQAALASGLTYAGDTSGVTPTASGSTLTWNLPDLGFQGGGQFLLWVRLPLAGYGSRYPVALSVDSDGPEANPANNRDTVQLVIGRRTCLPLVLRSY